jgi:hypothetical protein
MRTLITVCALAGSMLMAGPADAQQQPVTGTGQFCFKVANGPVQCLYQTMAQCEQARPAGSTEQCLDRTRIGGTMGVGQDKNPKSNAESPSNPAPE